MRHLLFPSALALLLGGCDRHPTDPASGIETAVATWTGEASDEAGSYAVTLTLHQQSDALARELAPEQALTGTMSTSGGPDSTTLASAAVRGRYGPRGDGAGVWRLSVTLLQPAAAPFAMSCDVGPADPDACVGGMTNHGSFRVTLRRR